MRKSFSLLILPVVFVGLSWPVVAANKKTKVEIKHKSRDLQKIKSALQQKKAEKERLEKEARKISSQVKESQSKMGEVEKSLLFLLKRNREVEQGLASEKIKNDILEETISSSETQFKNAVQMAFVSSHLLGPHAPLPVFSRQIIQGQYQNLTELEDQKVESNQELNQLTENYEIYQQEMIRQKGELSGLKQGVVRRERKLRKTRTRQDVIEGEVRELNSTAEELEALIDILRSRARKEQAQEKKARLEKSASGQSPIPRHSLLWPLKGTVVRRFGRQKHPELGTPYISNGLLIESNKPMGLKAVYDGVVLYAGVFMSYGPMVVIEHPGDWYSVYGQLLQWNVEKGQEIKKGQIVGKTSVSDAGRNQGYFELRFYGKPVNPKPWLKKG